MSMIVHLTGSSRSLEHDRPHLQHIIDIIHAEGHVLARDCAEITKDYASNQKDAVIDWPVIFQDNIQAITRADVVIIESTNYGFSQGFQVATALQQKKPTLLLWRKESPMQERFGTGGFMNDLITTRMYTSSKELEDEITAFLEDNTLSTKDMRFNFFIDRQIYNYLRWSSTASGRTKSDILRGLLEKEIERQGKSV